MNAMISDENTSIAGLRLSGIVPLCGGRNNRVYRAYSSDGYVLVKEYFYDPQDSRDRLKTEFSMLSFLWNNGIRSVPEPLAADHIQHIGIFRYIEGEAITVTDISENDCVSLCSLLQRMWQLRSHRDAADLPDASEACFSLPDYLSLLQRRVDRLREIGKCTSEEQQVHELLNAKLLPHLELLHERIGFNGPHHDVLPREKRTLSPSDLGFHNALRRKGGELVFLDFEYAGWDDPAKMLSDALLQPDKPVPQPYQVSFLQNFRSIFKQQPDLLPRLEQVYYLSGLKWCLILLNEFVPLSESRRRFSIGNISQEMKQGRIDQTIRFHSRLENELKSGYMEKLLHEVLAG